MDLMNSQRAKSGGLPGGSYSSNSSSRPFSQPRSSSTTGKTRVGSAGSSRSHSEVLSCHLCGREFKSTSTFNEHIKVFHTRGKISARPREALYSCRECGKAFTSPSKRTLHLNAVHRGLRPHQCNVCEKSFGYKGGT